LLLSPAVTAKLTAAGVDRHVRGWEKASDHAPALDNARGTAPEDKSEALNWRGRRRLSYPPAFGVGINPISAILARLFASIMGI
jgi:hypothetical protein